MLYVYFPGNDRVLPDAVGQPEPKSEFQNETWVLDLACDFECYLLGTARYCPHVGSRCGQNES